MRLLQKPACDARIGNERRDPVSSQSSQNCIGLLQSAGNANDLWNSTNLLSIYGQTDLIQRTADYLTLVVDQGGADIGARPGGEHLFSPSFGERVVQTGDRRIPGTNAGNQYIDSIVPFQHLSNSRLRLQPINQRGIFYPHRQKYGVSSAMTGARHAMHQINRALRELQCRQSTRHLYDVNLR